VNEIVASFVHRFGGNPDPDWQPGSVFEICSDSEQSGSDSGAVTQIPKIKRLKEKKGKLLERKGERMQQRLQKH
jgi:hypothetical protein